MNAMSAPSAAPAGLMPLSLIADHKSSQPPSNVQSLQRSGSEKCVTAGVAAKPTANGMEGAGPLPLVSQLVQSSSLPPAMPELTSQQSTNLVTNSDTGVQSSAAHVYHAPHQNVSKPLETGSQQEEKGPLVSVGGGAVSSVTGSGESRLTEENSSVTTAHQLHPMSSTVATTVTTISTTVETTKSSVSSQQPQPSNADMKQIVSPDTTSSTSPIVVPSNPGETQVAATASQPISATDDAVEEAVTRNETASSTTAPTNEVAVVESTNQPHPVATADESAFSVQISSTQLSPKSENQTETPISPAKSTSQVSPSNAGSGSVSTTIPTPTSNLSPVINTTSQPQNVENSSKTSSQRQAPKRVAKAVTTVSAVSETSKKSSGDKEVSEDKKVVDKPRRKRLPTQPYQSPIPELTIIAKYRKMKEMNEKEKVEKKLSNSYSDKLIVFYRNEFLAVRNAEGGFYVCQAMQNVYKSSSRIRIRWLSQQPDPLSDVYKPDFYDHTEFDCILTNLNLERVEKDKFRLPQTENRRTESILQRAIDVERGVAPPPADDTLTEAHPDGLDLSLYRNEEQLKKRKKMKRKSGRKKESRNEDDVRSQTSLTRSKTGSTGGSTVSATSVAKAKKAAAIKRTTAKRVVQAAAARRQASTAAPSATGTNKKVVTSVTSTGNKATLNNAGGTVAKKDKMLTSSSVNKRKASTTIGTSAVPDKRTRRGNPPSQNQNATSSNTQTKTRGNPGTQSSSNTSSKSSTSTTSGGGGNNAVGSNGTAANTRRTLRNSK